MSVPLIDISSFCENTNEELKKICANEVKNALAHKTGFMMIQNYQQLLPQEIIEEALVAARSFFELPLEEKQKHKGKQYEGYFGIGDENNAIYPQAGDEAMHAELGDYKEAFGVDREDDVQQIGLPCVQKTPWPEVLGDNFRTKILACFNGMMKIGRVLTRIMAASLGLDENWFEDKLENSPSALRLLHYPPQQAEPRLGIGAHTDFGFLTILVQTEEALQVFHNDKWETVPMIPRTLVINVCDIMQRWTNDIFKSPLHRVINNSGKHRLSLVLFFDPDYNAIVSCIDSCKEKDEPAKYPPVKYGDYLTAMFQRQKDLEAKTINKK